MTISIFRAFLCGVIYYFSDCPWFPNVGYSIFARPLVCGALVGIILGDIPTGVQMGVSIQLINMGMIVAGGSMPTDMAMAGTVGTALGILLRPSMGDDALTVALSLSVALGMVGSMRFVARMTWNTFFNHGADKAVAKGDLRGLCIWNLVLPQVALAALGILPVTAFLMAAGNETVLAGLNTVLSAIAGPLKGVGMLLPSLGIGLLLTTIGNKRTIPFFVIAFVLSRLLGISIIGMSVIAVMVAFLLTFGRDEPDQGPSGPAAAAAEQLPDLE